MRESNTGSAGHQGNATPPASDSTKRDEEMNKQASDRPPDFPGQARVESRVAVWLQCPLCQQEHTHILTARDHLDLPGTRYWRIDCHGSRYVMGVPASSIAGALALASAIATGHSKTVCMLLTSGEHGVW